MTFTRFITHLLSLFVITLTIAACSGGSTPNAPGTDNAPESFGVAMGDRNIVAIYDAVIDPVAETFTITPSDDRTAAYHFPLTNLYPGCVKVTGYGFVPNFWADIKLIHPLPGSGINGYDPRVISVIPANTGVSFTYPTFAVRGNNAAVLQHDGWTGLYDALGGSIAGNVNPFVCYFKSQPYRVWASTGMTTETIRWNIKLAGFGGPIVYKLIVDVSTNYPAPPTPVTDNAKEPYVLNIQVGSGLTPTGGSANVEVVLLDWQGKTGISCAVECPSLFAGLVNLAYDGAGPNPDTYKFKASITNSLGAAEGDYPLLVGAKDNTSGIYNYHESSAHVAPVTSSKVHSEAFKEKVAEDTWFDICVQSQGPVYVVADHPATDNVGGSGENGTRTALKFANNLSTMDVINPGTGMASPYPDNWDYLEDFHRMDVSDGGMLMNDVGGGTLGTWIVSGTTATNYACCWQYQCGLMSTIADIADHRNPPGYGTGVNCYAVLNVGCSPQVDWTLGFSDYDPANYSGYNFAPALIFADIYSVKGIECITDDINEVLLYSSDTEGMLAIVGDIYSGVGNLAIIDSTGSFGREDGNFYGGLDVAMDTKDNILTLEDQAGTFRFQKFNASLTWLWSSGWVHPGKPMRMDFDKSNDNLYLLCDNGIHICTVD